MLRPATSFDPNLIAPEFNPALVSCFDHELPDCNNNFYDVLITAYGQYEDMLHAYLYAKETILPWIKKNGVHAITPEQLLGWIKKAHSHIALSLGHQMGFIPGQYTSGQVLRWQWGSSSQECVGNYIFGQDTQGEIIQTALNHKWTTQEIKDLFRALDKIKFVGQPLRDRMLKNAKIKNFTCLDESALGSIMLTEAYYSEDLNQEEKAIISKMVTVCLRPEQFPAVMQDFAEKFVAAWKVCDPSNEEQFSSLLLDAYNGVAGIHPFANCNGRTGTWLLNLISVSLDKPSFLLREPGDKNNAESAYSMAIDTINIDPALFKKYILSVIAKAEAGLKFDDSKNYEIAMRRNQTLTCIREMGKFVPLAKLAHMCRANLIEIQKVIIPEYGIERLEKNERDVMFVYSELELSLFTRTLEEAKKEASTVKLSQFADRVTSSKLSKDEIIELKKILCAITGCNDWKDYRQGTDVRVLFDDKSMAIPCMSLIKKADACTMKLMKDSTTQKAVVQLTEINLNKFREFYQRVSVSAAIAKQESQSTHMANH